MRFLYGRMPQSRLTAELDSVQSAMLSSRFVFIDLFIYSLFFAIMLLPVFHKLITALLFLAAINFLGILIYLVLKKCLKQTD